MTPNYWNDWYLAWGWVLWFGMILLFISGIWNWSYSYNSNQKYRIIPEEGPLDILKARFARGDIPKEEYQAMKKEILKDS